MVRAQMIKEDICLPCHAGGRCNLQRNVILDAALELVGIQSITVEYQELVLLK